ncbi:Oidioi.mRNA.OKI2018_I69.PAR.g11921.t1.cds [Oikopleura dioica]|uniref:Oidioi.mRNA.OKI2018_I69.PAR.g11921.t1.cds n=1 Tax=Oikopleura dioica TaxID=34765 RepID=A0ABN7RYJ6_OIKDI|nr:Oidioi.mRNA.OKI2018_I69.PAR.g11921.t1.cds [Oikopleura dioica]
MKLFIFCLFRKNLAQLVHQCEIADLGENQNNGTYECDHFTCELKCPHGFYPNGGTGHSTCVPRPGGWGWSRRIGKCSTCSDLALPDELQSSCVTTNNGQRVCNVSCKNKQAIKPRNNDKTIVACKCNVGRRSGCHWVSPGNVIVDDRERDEQNFIGNWYCNNLPLMDDLQDSNIKSEENEDGHPVFRIPPNLKCPSSNPEIGEIDRIYGGVSAIPHSWPWMASLWFGRFGCGGTIIGDKTVLTAAHCCDGYKRKLKKIRVKSGDHKYFEHDTGEEEHRVKRVFVHPGYSRRTMQNDICILAVEDMGLDRKPTADRACLPEPGWLPAAGTRCWAAGWGVTEKGTFPTDLQEVDLDILTNEECANGGNHGKIDEKTMFCAGGEGGKDGCQGDSGGPLICKDETGKIPIITGVTSWGLACGVAETPGVWTKVSSYLDWIGKVQNFVDRAL